MKKPKTTGLPIPTAKQRASLIVAVEREYYGGEAVSSIRHEPPLANFHLVIDRERRRGPIDLDALIHRARRAAELLNLPFKLDLSPRCNAMLKVHCNCPTCQKKRYD